MRTVTDGTEDSVILHFKARQAVYEGNARTGEFKNSGISLPDIATGCMRPPIPVSGIS